MLKFNFLALTLMVSVTKRQTTAEELAHIKQIQDINKRILEHRAEYYYYK